MGDFFGIDVPEFDLFPDKATPEAKRSRHLLSEGKKWDGKGAPPSRDAAIGWLMQNHLSQRVAEEAVGDSGTLTSVGKRARAAAEARSGRDAQWDAEHPSDDPGAQAQAIIDATSDGDVSDDELEAILGEGPGAATDTRGAPLWRYEGSPESLATLVVDNKSWQDKSVQNAKRGGFGKADQKKTGARYYEQDTLGPLRWSPEQRADLQRVLHGIGIYGDAKIKLGSWTAKDQAAYAELLASANEEGLTWHEMLAQWKRHPPEDILAELKDSGAVSKRPTIQVTNPLDIMQTAKDVSRNLTGEVDRGFVEGTVGPYQGAETASQNAAYSVGEAGNGGTVASPPSVEAFADDRLRRTDPIEVDGYQFLGQFQSLMSMLGVQ